MAYLKLSKYLRVTVVATMQVLSSLDNKLRIRIQAMFLSSGYH